MKEVIKLENAFPGGWLSVMGARGGTICDVEGLGGA